MNIKPWNVRKGDKFQSRYGETVTADYVERSDYYGFLIVTYETNLSGEPSKYHPSNLEGPIETQNGRRDIRREKVFRPSHFNQGDIVEYSIHRDKNLTIDVDHIRQNGADSWLIVSAHDDEAPFEYMKKSVNLSHMTRIVSRGSKPAKIVRYDSPLDKYKECNFLRGEVDKHRSRYLVTNLRMLLVAICEEFLVSGQYVDFEKLTLLVTRHNILKLHYTLGEYEVAHTVSKKKLRKLVKQLLPKCIRKKKDVVREERKLDEEMRGDPYSCEDDF